MGKYSAKSAKKPITKKWWFWTLVAFVAIGVIGNLLGLGGEQQSTAALNTTPALTTPAITEAPTAAPTEAETVTEATSALPFNVSFESTYRNDVTGKWRKALIATSEPIEEYALAYYHEYFKSDDEIHFIFNFTLNTTNVLRVQSGALNVSVHEYVDKEEHDAKVAPSGMVLDEFYLDMSTGEKLNFD